MSFLYRDLYEILKDPSNTGKADIQRKCLKLLESEYKTDRDLGFHKGVPISDDPEKNLLTLAFERRFVLLLDAMLHRLALEPTLYLNHPKRLKAPESVYVFVQMGQKMTPANSPDELMKFYITNAIGNVYYEGTGFSWYKDAEDPRHHIGHSHFLIDNKFVHDFMQAGFGTREEHNILCECESCKFTTDCIAENLDLYLSSLPEEGDNELTLELDQDSLIAALEGKMKKPSPFHFKPVSHTIPVLPVPNQTTPLTQSERTMLANLEKRLVNNPSEYRLVISPSHLKNLPTAPKGTYFKQWNVVLQAFKDYKYNNQLNVTENIEALKSAISNSYPPQEGTHDFSDLMMYLLNK